MSLPLPHEYPPLPSPLRLYGAALLTARKKNRPAPLPALSLARPEVTLDTAHIARYAEICGFLPAHGVPLTYPHMLAFPLHMLLMADPAFPWSMMGMVHLSNTIHQHQRIEPGQQVRVEVCLEHPQAHEKGQVFSLTSRILDTRSPQHECLWESDSAYLRSGIHTPHGTPCQSRLTEVHAHQPSQEWLLDGRLGQRYGRLSGDLNPIHLHRLTALAFGFPRAIAHGMWTKARALAALMPAQPVDTAQIRVEFKTPLLLPGKATLWADPYTQDHGQCFEVRDGRGEKPHLRGFWQAD
ncbi:MAG: hypothetical protein KBD39_03590 [Sterolibacterium sp.]|nr:hypothetical protein [Sterolibacterium sp.]MBP9799178.1 hypothetical protein [Sterolibacterium sp.]